MRLNKKQLEGLIRVGEDQTLAISNMNSRMSRDLQRVGQAMIEANRPRLIEDSKILIETFRELAKGLEDYADTQETLVGHWEGGGALTLEECEDEECVVN